MANPFINAYKSVQDLGAEASGLDSRDDAPIPQAFQKIFDGMSEGNKTATVEDVSTNMFMQTRDLMKKAENQSQLAAEGKADPLEVAHTMNNVTHAAELLTTSISKGLQAYQSIANLQL